MADEEHDPRNPASRPLTDYTKVGELLKEVAQKHGLYLQGIAVIPPADEHSPVFIQASFAVGEVATELIMDEQPEHDRIEGESESLEAQFNEIMEGSKKSEAETIADQLKRDFDAGEGIFGE